MKIIKLTRGYETVVDDEDYDWLSKYNWNASWRGAAYYAYRPRLNSDGPGPSTIAMHRTIMKTPDGLFVDHINENTLDNRKENLRNCTRAQNYHHRKKRRDSQCSFKGIHKDSNGSWKTRISLNGKRYYIGSYRNERLAALVYDAAARLFHGEFAVTNFGDTYVPTISNR